MAAIGSAGIITPGAIWASGLFSGFLRLLMGLSGAVTAGVAMWNMGAAYLGGLALWYGFQRGWLKA